MKRFTLVIVLVILACAPHRREIDMRFPPHLFKPVNANEFNDSYGELIADATIHEEFYEIVCPERVIIVIKEIENTNEIDKVALYYYKDSQILFFHGKDTASEALPTRPNYFFCFLRENPIILKEGDTLKIFVTNNSGASHTVQFMCHGYTYQDPRFLKGE